MQDIQAIKTQLSEELAAATSDPELEEARVRYLGRKGVVTLLRKNADFSSMSANEKKQFGQQQVLHSVLCRIYRLSRRN